MAEAPANLLIVDDNPDNCELLVDIFEDDYTLSVVHNGQDCLNAVRENAFDLVLLDVNMPGMDGYEVCQRIKSSSDTALIPIVFVSALVSAEERLRGYEVGAEEYVTKPFHSKEITDTVTRVLEHHLQNKEFETRSKEAMNTAFQAMTNSAELGNIIRFFQTSYNCKSVDQLAQELLETTNLFGLKCCLKIQGRYKTEYFGCAKDSIEAKVLERFSTGDKVLDFGARTLINEQHVSLLIRNMPVDQPEAYGRIKDNLAVLVDGTEARVKALELEYKLEDERNRGIQSVLVNSHEKLREIRTLVERQKNDAQNISQSINSKIEEIIFSLGLEESQEQIIIDAIDKSVDGLNSVLDISTQLEASFLRFVNDLDNLVNNE